VAKSHLRGDLQGAWQCLRARRAKPSKHNLSRIMKFVDLKEYDLERFESEKRTEEKRKKLKK